MATPAIVIDVVTRDVPPADVYERYIKRRIPVVFRGLAIPGFSTRAKTVSGWRAVAGDSTVHVEERDGSTGTYGTGKKRPMPFAAFLDKLKGGAEDLYLTTQPLPEDGDGLPLALCGAPVDALLAANDLPLRPALMGNLVPSNINVWIGQAKSGSSSNLHHDFHDNLYVLLEGRKRFTLSPPSNAPNMYLHGCIRLIHDNGLINYRGCATRDDGALPHLVVEHFKRRLRRCKEADTADQYRTYLRSAEKSVRKFASSHDADSTSDSEDFEAGTVDDMWSAMLTGAYTFDPAVKAKRKSGGPGAGGSSSGSDRAATGRDSGKGSAVGKGKSAMDGVGPMPSHFSKISLPALRASVAAVEPSLKGPGSAIARGGSKSGGCTSNASVPDVSSFRNVQSAPSVARDFPLFPRAALAVVDLLPGDMLYLPASWFHEVVSFSESPDGSSSAPVMHAAVNYWYHPPSVHKSASFAAPYRDCFWEDTLRTQLRK